MYVSQLDRSNAGVYTCNVRNTEGSLNGTFDFDVKEKLDLNNKDFKPIPRNKRTKLLSYRIKHEFLSEVDALQRK